MDQDRFDAIARRLAASGTSGITSRRYLLRGVAAAGAGLLTGRQAADAGCPPDQVQRRGLGCVCRLTGRPPDESGICRCASGLTRCGDACLDLSRDLAHCGACDAACTAGAGVAELVCRQGACRVRTCAAGWANCDGDLVCETPLGTDTDCAACGDACAGPDEHCCDGACVDLSHDLVHCGTCDNACVAGEGVAELVCLDGSCRVKSCTAGLANCDGDLVCETALGTDANCSACADACSIPDEHCIEDLRAGEYSCSLCPVISFDVPTCFWMENVSGNDCWVPAEEELREVPTRDLCQKVDSCSPGGGGLSGGGCYKWAISTHGPRIAPPW